MTGPFYLCVGDRIDCYADPQAERAVCEPHELAEEQEADRMAATSLGEVLRLESDVLWAAIRRLPAVEQTVLVAHMAGEHQAATGARLGIAQQTVSDRRRAAVRRIRLIVDLDLLTLNADAVLTELFASGFDPEPAELLVTFLASTSYVQTARDIGCSETKVRRCVKAAATAMRGTRIGDMLEALTAERNALCGRRQCTTEPAPEVCDAPAYDGPRELRPLSDGEVAELRASGRTVSELADKHVLDPSYLDYVLHGAWGQSC